MWVKLVQAGISCKMLKMIKSIYQNVKSCVKNHKDMSYSELFDVTLGVKQGEPLSPLLFILFINDINDCININNLTEKDIRLLSIYMLLFADDIALFTTNQESLQLQLNSIYQYSCKWGLKINVNKTKICIFEKRKSTCLYSWTINQQALEIVDEFCYLGLKLHYTGNISKAIKANNEQALKAYNHLLSIFSKVKLSTKTKLSLFDSLVVPIILYGSEIWGIYNIKEVDKLNFKFCKTILGVRSQTSNAAVLGELGRFPLSIICKQRALSYWIKIKQNPNSLMHTVYNEQCNIYNENNNNNTNMWCAFVKQQLDQLGHGIFYNNLNDNCNYSYEINQRIKDQFIQNWHDTINSQPKLEYYKMFKTEFAYEKYLDCINNRNNKQQLSRFRLSTHKLEKETGRYNSIPIDERKCKLCNANTVESEYHFFLTCSIYKDLRTKYCIRSNWPNLVKFKNILSCQNTTVINNVARFITEAMKLRDEKLEVFAAS